MFPQSVFDGDNLYFYVFIYIFSGGNTGLVFGSTPIADEIVLSLQRMNRILEFDEGIGAVQCQAGTVLQQIEDYAGNYDFTIPLDLGSKGSCTIGGRSRRVAS